MHVRMSLCVYTVCMYMCTYYVPVSYGSRNKQRLFRYTTLTGWSS